jgi:hypothetical protein
MSAPKSDSATVEARRSRLLELLSSGKNQVECSIILKSEGFPADRNTLWRDFAVLRTAWRGANLKDYSEMYEAHVTELQVLKAEVLSMQKEGLPLTLHQVDRLLSILELDMKLKGTQAPTKSISVNLSGALQGLSIEQQQQVAEFARGLVVEKEQAPDIIVNFVTPKKDVQ